MQNFKEINNKKLLKNWYLDDQKIQLDHPYFRENLLNRWKNFGTLLEIFLAKFKTLPKKINILDAGCGNGNSIIFLKNFFNHKQIDTNIIAIDYNISRIKTIPAQKQLKIELGDLNELKYKNNSFDIILFSHVLEHLENYQKPLLELRSILKNTDHKHFFTLKLIKDILINLNFNVHSKIILEGFFIPHYGIDVRLHNFYIWRKIKIFLQRILPSQSGGIILMVNKVKNI